MNYVSRLVGTQISLCSLFITLSPGQQSPAVGKGRKELIRALGRTNRDGSHRGGKWPPHCSPVGPVKCCGGMIKQNQRKKTIFSEMTPLPKSGWCFQQALLAAYLTPFRRCLLWGMLGDRTVLNRGLDTALGCLIGSLSLIFLIHKIIIFLPTSREVIKKTLTKYIFRGFENCQGLSDEMVWWWHHNTQHTCHLPGSFRCFTYIV